MSRRSFLQTSALAGLGGAAAVSVASPARAAVTSSISGSSLSTSYWPGGTPTWRVVVPSNARGTIIALHGSFGSPADWWGLGVNRWATRYGMAIAAVDGGATYWHKRADGSDTGTMVIKDLIPTLARAGAPMRRIGLMGLSMGGYGAFLLAPRIARKYLIGVAAMSTAVWTDYGAAAAEEWWAFDSANDYAANDIYARASLLSRTPVWMSCGTGDDFHAANVALKKRLPRAYSVFDDGGHNGDYWKSHMQGAVSFLAHHC